MFDAELVLRARGGDELAFRRLLDRHGDLIEIYTRTYFAPGAERSDLHQEGLYGLHKAVRDYRPDGGSHFRGFASLCIKRQVITAVKAATRYKHGVLNSARSLEGPAHVGSDDGLILAETLPGTSGDPYQALAVEEELAEVRDRLRDLSPLERQAVVGVAQGDPYELVAAAAGADSKAIDNALQRARRKLADRSPQPRRRIWPDRLMNSPSAHRAARSPAKSPHPEKEIAMSIMESIDAERASVQEEINALEEQLESKHMRLTGLDELRQRAEALDSGEAKPAPTPPPPVKTQNRPALKGVAGAESLTAERVERVVELVAQHPAGHLTS